MARSELMEKVKTAFETYKSNNRGLPWFLGGMPELLQAIIQYLEEASPDYSVLVSDIASIKEQIEQGKFGLKEEEVKALIDSSLVAVLKSIGNIEDKNTQQETDLDNLAEDAQNKASQQEFIELKNVVDELQKDLLTNQTRDGKQDEAILKLQEERLFIIENEVLTELQDEVKKLQEDLGTNDALDTKQSQDILTLQKDIQNIPTSDVLTALHTAVAKLQTDLISNGELDAQQAIDIGSFKEWETEAKNTLQEILSRLKNVEDNDQTFNQTILDLQQKLNELGDSFNQQLEPLKVLPEKVSLLEIKLNTFQPGINEEKASSIAEGKVKELRESVEKRLNALDTSIGGVGDLNSRLKKAETDVLRLFALLDQGGTGIEDGEVSKSYVKAELSILEKLLRDEMTTINDRYEALLTLPDEFRRLKDEVPGKTTPEQVAQLIQSAIESLVSFNDLRELEEKITTKTATDLSTLNTTLRQAYEAYVGQQLAIFGDQVATAEAKLRTELTDLMDTQLSTIWEALPDQALPEVWLEKVLVEVNQLNVTLSAEIQKQTQEWDHNLSETLIAADEANKSVILDQIAKIYATQELLKTEKNSLITTITTKIEEFAQTLPHAYTEAEIKAFAVAEAAKLDEVLSGRIQALVDFDFDTRVKALKTFQEQTEKLDLENFKKFVLDLKLVELAALVGTLDTWKTTAESDIAALKDKVANLLEPAIITLTSTAESLKPRVDTLTSDVAKLQEEQLKSSAFETATRLSRICLTGWGLAGGLEILSDSVYCIHISAGQGVTPDGHLLILPQPTYFNDYIVLKDEEKNKLNQAFFKDIPVWELIPSELRNTIDKSILRWLSPQTNQERDRPFTTDKVILLMPGPRFLLVTIEDFLTNIKLLDRVRHDEGSRRNFEHSDYLFSTQFSPADDTLSDDSLYRAFNPALSLRSIPLHRFGFRPADDCTPEELDKTEFPVIESLKDIYNTWKPIIEEALHKVNKQMAVLLNEYHPLLFPQLAVKPFQDKLNILLTNWTVYTRLAEAKEKNIEMCYAQYFYDWARDLIQAYHELREELQVLMAELCLLTPESLSKRSSFLTLGPAFRPDQDGLAAPFRDEFHQPPIYNGNAERLEKTRLYYRRLFELVESFYIEKALPDERLPEIFRREEGDPFVVDTSKIKITPGKKPGSLLADQAIPFYYPLSAGAGSLHYYWSYRHTKARRCDQLLSYHASDSDAHDSYNHPDDWHVTRPLFFSLDNCNFYRIEGFIGKSEVTVDGIDFNLNTELNIYEAIRYLVHKHNLDFEVMLVKITDGLTETFSGELEIEASEKNNAFSEELLGAEHLGGVPKGGTFIIVIDSDGVAIADFSLPFR